MWNEIIKQNIISELNEQLDTINPIAPAKNHSYADSIFSEGSSTMFKPMSTDIFEVPNYFETTISRTRTIKEIPVHTLAFADSFETSKPIVKAFSYTPVSAQVETQTREPVSDASFDMDQIINSTNTVTINLSPEQRGVAIAKKVTWSDIFFEDASLIKNTRFAEMIKKICMTQIKI